MLQLPPWLHESAALLSVALAALWLVFRWWKVGESGELGGFGGAGQAVGCARCDRNPLGATPSAQAQAQAESSRARRSRALRVLS